MIGELPEAEDLYTNKKVEKKKLDTASKNTVKSIIDIGNQVTAMVGAIVGGGRNHLDQKSGSKKPEQVRSKEGPVVEHELDQAARGSLFGTLNYAGSQEYE